MQRFQLIAIVAAIAALLVIPVAASAHPHTIERNGQVIANGQLHGPFSDSDGDGNATSCGGDPAAYGIETAHHGPDSGRHGKADGCYQIDGLSPAADDRNPAIN